MYAQEDVEDLSFSGHGQYLPEGIIFFLRTEGSFYGSGSHSGQFFSYELFTIMINSFSSLLCKVGFDMCLTAQRPVFISGITVVAGEIFQIHIKKSLVKCDTVGKPAALVKGIEGKFLDE